MASHFSIRAVAEETGLSVHTIRAWERRYGVTTPGRTVSNRRVYGTEEVQRLKLIRQAAEAGHSVGLIAKLPTDELARLLASSKPRREEAHRDGGFLDSCRRALRQLDGDALNSEMTRAASLLGVDRFVKEVVLPLVATLDEEWSRGSLTIAEEHLFSAQVKTHLDTLRLSIQPDRQAPMAIVATPVNQHHEIGAMLAAIVAARAGWSVTYLGPNLPAGEIASAARTTRAQVVALSIVYPESDPVVDRELAELSGQLGQGARLVVGGRAAASYGATLRAHGASVCENLDDLREALERPASAAV